MTPVLLATLLGAGLLALVPTRRLAERTDRRWAIAAYYGAIWLLIAALVLVPPLRRIALPVALLLLVAPWLTLRDGIGRLAGRSPRGRRTPPRNVTPPEAGGPFPR